MSLTLYINILLMTLLTHSVIGKNKQEKTKWNLFYTYSLLQMLKNKLNGTHAS